MDEIQLEQSINIAKQNKSRSITGDNKCTAEKVKVRKLALKKKKNDITHQFIPILVKLSILSFWCSISTLLLGFTLWQIYPTITSVIDSTINAFCVYLCFSCNDKLYQVLCLPLISCKHCTKWRRIIVEAKELADAAHQRMTSRTKSISTMREPTFNDNSNILPDV